jgi:glycerol-3-phosphate dehydrogenase
LRVLGRPRIRDSANLPIGGGKGYPRMPEHTTLPQERLATLVERYGTGADKVAAYLQAGPDAPLSCHSGYTRREIEFIARHEHVVHLDDLILRRTLMGMLGEVSRPLLEELAAIIAPMLAWSQPVAQADVERTVELLKRVHGVTLAR